MNLSVQESAKESIEGAKESIDILNKATTIMTLLERLRI